MSGVVFHPHTISQSLCQQLFECPKRSQNSFYGVCGRIGGWGVSGPLQDLSLTPISETLPWYTAKCLEASLTQGGAKGERCHLVRSQGLRLPWGHDRGLTGSLRPSSVSKECGQVQACSLGPHFSRSQASIEQARSGGDRPQTQSPRLLPNICKPNSEALLSIHILISIMGTSLVVHW